MAVLTNPNQPKVKTTEWAEELASSINDNKYTGQLILQVNNHRCIKKTSDGETKSTLPPLPPPPPKSIIHKKAEKCENWFTGNPQTQGGSIPQLHKFLKVPKQRTDSENFQKI